ncbi:hypothetical protein F2P46_21865 [Massilia sp. CCM 8734]|nr:hypothetical protein [Massilia sp. CCM 8734]
MVADREIFPMGKLFSQYQIAGVSISTPSNPGPAPFALMKNLSIGTRLTLGFALVLLFLVALTGIGVWRMQQASVMTDNMVKDTVRNERLIDGWAKVIEVNAARTLAQRSAAAAKEIKQLISDSVSKVDNGTRLVDQAGKTMGEVLTSINRVTRIMNDITSASDEQRDGIEQLNLAVTQMDQVTQQNAALVEQAAAAAAMQDQAAQLSQVVGVFKLGQLTGGRRALALVVR